MYEDEFIKFYDSDAFDPIIKQYLNKVYLPNTEEIIRSSNHEANFNMTDKMFLLNL